jgi:hypothetical protein
MNDISPAGREVYPVAPTAHRGGLGWMGPGGEGWVHIGHQGVSDWGATGTVI